MCTLKYLASTIFSTIACIVLQVGRQDFSNSNELTTVILVLEKLHTWGKDMVISIYKHGNVTVQQ